MGPLPAEIQRLNEIGDRENGGPVALVPPGASTNGALGCDREMGGREAFIENTIIEPIELILDGLCEQQTRGFRDNICELAMAWLITI